MVCKKPTMAPPSFMPRSVETPFKVCSSGGKLITYRTIAALDRSLRHWPYHEALYTSRLQSSARIQVIELWSPCIAVSVSIPDELTDRQILSVILLLRFTRLSDDHYIIGKLQFGWLCGCPDIAKELVGCTLHLQRLRQGFHALNLLLRHGDVSTKEHDAGVPATNTSNKWTVIGPYNGKHLVLIQHSYDACPVAL